MMIDEHQPASSHAANNVYPGGRVVSVMKRFSSLQNRGTVGVAGAYDIHAGAHTDGRVQLDRRRSSQDLLFCTLRISVFINGNAAIRRHNDYLNLLQECISRSLSTTCVCKLPQPHARSPQTRSLQTRTPHAACRLPLAARRPPQIRQCPALEIPHLCHAFPINRDPRPASSDQKSPLTG